VLPDFTPTQWLFAVLAAIGVGLSKSGLYGVGLFHVVVFANLFPGLASTGVVLPMLIAADVGAVMLFRRHAEWRYVRRTLPPAVVGVAIGWAVMGWTQRQGVPGARFNPVIGGVVLAMAAAQIVRNQRPNLFADVPHTHGFAWTMGLLAGVTTMVANAAGPVMALYLLAVALPKDEFVGTGAWFFLLINCIKVPFSAQLGLITSHTLLFNALLVPLIIVGLFIGRSVVTRVPQVWFDRLILIFAGLAALKLMW
jgi:uncharacterized membrane protein YfcA